MYQKEKNISTGNAFPFKLIYYFVFKRNFVLVINTVCTFRKTVLVLQRLYLPNCLIVSQQYFNFGTVNMFIAKEVTIVDSSPLHFEFSFLQCMVLYRSIATVLCSTFSSIKVTICFYYFLINNFILHILIKEKVHFQIKWFASFASM